MRHIRRPLFDEYCLANGDRLQFFAPPLWRFGVRVLCEDLSVTIALPTMSIKLRRYLAREPLPDFDEASCKLNPQQRSRFGGINNSEVR